MSSASKPKTFCEEGPTITHPKRARHDSDSGTEIDKDNISPPKRRKVKTPAFVVKDKEMRAFFRLMEDPLIFDFLQKDYCKRITDKSTKSLAKLEIKVLIQMPNPPSLYQRNNLYLLAMVFAYFKRANYSIREFTRRNFFTALYLACDIEEDEEDYKYEVFPWALGSGWNEHYMGFLKRRDKLWTRIGYRAVVSKKCCDEIMSIDLDHWLWKRVRPEHHSGAFRQHVRDQDSDDDVYPRGPNASPRKCQQCASLMEYDSASPGDASWYLSSSSESSPELIGLKMCKITRIVASSRFDMNGLRKMLPEERGGGQRWVHKEE